MRTQDWAERLHAAVTAEIERPFAWGDADCITLARAAMKACRGPTWEFPVSTTWKTEAGAAKVIARLSNGRGLAEVFAGYCEEVPPVMAQRGDIGILKNAALVCVGNGFVGKSLDGKVFLPPASIERAFRT